MVDLLNGDNDAGVRYAPTGGPQRLREFRQRCRKCKMCARVCVCVGACVCVCVGLIDGAVNTGVHLGGVTARMKLSEHYTLQSEGNE